MHLLIVYEDLFGVIKSITDKMVSVLDTKFVTCKSRSVDVVNAIDVKNADMIIIGSPTTHGGPSEGIKRFFIQFGPLLREKNITSFTAIMKGFLPGMNRSANSKIKRYLMKLSCFMLHQQKQFYIKSIKGPLCDNEDDKIKEFAKYLWIS